MVDVQATAETEFKETEVGLIPSDWDVTCLGDVATEFFGGGTPSTKRAEYWNGEILWTTSAYIDDSLYLDKGAGYITQKGLDESSSRLVPQGNLLIGTRVGVGKVAINIRDTAISQDLTAAIIDNSAVDREFLAYAIKWDKTQDAFLASMRGTTIKGIPRADLVRIPIPLPPFPEQRRIAAVLNAIQDAIAAQDDVIAEARALKRSLMQRLFTYGPGREPAETKETEIGEIPAHWEVVELGQFTSESIRNGAFVKREQFGAGVPFLNVADIYKSATANLAAVERVAVTSEDLERYALLPGDLIFVRSSLKKEGVGQACIVEEVDEPSIFDCHLMRVRVDEKNAIPRFLAYYFLSEQGKSALIARSKMTTMTTINQAGLSGAFIPKPPIPEQIQIAEMLKIAEAKIDVEVDRKTALQDLFKSALHQLMTGQIRLLSDEGLPL